MAAHRLSYPFNTEFTSQVLAGRKAVIQIMILHEDGGSGKGIIVFTFIEEMPLFLYPSSQPLNHTGNRK